METNLEYWIAKGCELDGNLCEIGLGEGFTTLLLLEAASKCGKKVLGVDPFEGGWADMPEGYGRPYRKEAFEKRIEPYKEHFVFLNDRSLSVAAEKFLSVPLSLAFVDGLQYKGAVISDLRIVSHAQYIVLDDFNRSTGMSQVPEAIEEYLKTNKRTLIDLGRHAVLIK